VCSASGFTLIEILVALAISLLGALAIMQIYVGSEGSKRAASSLGEAQSGGVIAAYSIEREIQKAGMGFANTAALGCMLRSNLGSGFNNLPLQPISIIPAGAGQGHASNLWNIPPGDAGSDMLAIASGSGSVMTEGGYLKENVASGDSSLPVTVIESKLGDLSKEGAPGVVSGDYLLVAEADKTCTLGRVQGSAGGMVTLDFQAQAAYGKKQILTPVTGDVPTPTSDSMAYVLNLGQRLDLSVFAVRNGVLTRCDFLANNCSDSSNTDDTAVWTPVANDVVALIAQYGFDTTFSVRNKTVDLYCKSRVAPGGNCPGSDTGLSAPGANLLDQKERGCDWARIPSVQLAVVTRSGQYEKDEISPASLKLWPDSVSVPTTVGPVWTVQDRHYRYRVTHTTSVLRNVVWMAGWGASCP
jgi:type IV pilus assembly protein PilW